jgi:hypothetical protein
MTIGARPIATAAAAIVASVIPMFLTAALVPRLGADFRFGKVVLGGSVAGFHATSALAAPRFGRLVERVGPARCVEISAGIAAISSVAIAVAGRSATATLVLLTLAGLLAAVIVPRQPLRAGPPAARRVAPQVGPSLRALVLAGAPSA